MNNEILDDVIKLVTGEPEFEISESINSNDSDDNSTCSDTYSDIYSDETSEETPEKDIIPPYGCKHYLARCKIRAPCCDKIYSCRLCHDEENTHKIDRYKINKIICTKCDKEQGVHQFCNNDDCRICFSLYFCNKCMVFDDVDKKQFHCDTCRVCRVGGAENYYHCEMCNACISITLKNSHKCVDIKDAQCPICIDNLFESRTSITIMKCGHYMHKECLMSYLKTNYICPICSMSIIDTEYIYKMLETEVALTPMPDEYKDLKVKILCNDCLQKSETNFHIVALKCQLCSSYNTRQI